MDLQVKYRPRTLDEFMGHESTVALIKEDHKNNELAHTMMLVGDSGVGKTTLAYIIAKNLLQCNGLSIKEINAADARGIDEARDITKDLASRPILGEHKVIIVDEAHQLTTPAQNALLKPLESERNSHVYWIFCTTNPNSIIKTIKSRCKQYVLGPLSTREIVNVIRPVMEAEKITLPEEIIKIIVAKANGIPREAVKLLDQLKNAKSKIQADQIVKEFDTESEDFPKLGSFLKNPWSKVGPRLKDLYDKKSPEAIRIGLLSYYRVCLENSSNPEEAIRFFNIMEVLNTPIIYTPAKPQMTYMLYKINRILLER